MTDEQVQTEITVEETQQTAPVEDTGSEAAQTHQDTGGRGDLTEALRQEREARRALEQQINDPDFVYQRARSLGLTEEEAQEEAATTVAKPATSGYSQYQYFREIEKSQEKYPQLATDEEDQLAITALMNAKGLSPLAAADRYYSKFNKQVEAAKVEGAKAKEVTISEKEQAQTVVSTTSTTSGDAELESIMSRIRNQNNIKDSQKAHIDLLKWKEAHKK